MSIVSDYILKKGEPTSRLSVLFFLSIVLGIYIGYISYDYFVEADNMVVTINEESYVRLYLQALMLHIAVLLFFLYKRTSSYFMKKIVLLSIIIPLFVGINIGKLFVVKGLLGFSAGIVSYFPHYILLFVFYRGILKKIISNDTFYKTDYVKYVIIIMSISFVHVFISRTLSNMMI